MSQQHIIGCAQTAPYLGNISAGFDIGDQMWGGLRFLEDHYDKKKRRD